MATTAFDWPEMLSEMQQVIRGFLDPLERKLFSLTCRKEYWAVRKPVLQTLPHFDECFKDACAASYWNICNYFYADTDVVTRCKINLWDYHSLENFDKIVEWGRSKLGESMLKTPKSYWWTYHIFPSLLKNSHVSVLQMLHNEAASCMGELYYSHRLLNESAPWSLQTVSFLGAGGYTSFFRLEALVLHLDEEHEEVGLFILDRMRELIYPSTWYPLGVQVLPYVQCKEGPRLVALFKKGWPVFYESFRLELSPVLLPDS